MKLIIAGHRDFQDYKMMCYAIKGSFSIDDITLIVSGGAKGADKLGEYWARSHGKPYQIFEANWAAHQKAAGPIRNQQMALFGDALIAFIDPSRKKSGTHDMIDRAVQQRLQIVVIDIKNGHPISIPAIDKQKDFFSELEN